MRVRLRRRSPLSHRKSRVEHLPPIFVIFRHVAELAVGCSPLRVPVSNDIVDARFDAPFWIPQDRAVLVVLRVPPRVLPRRIRVRVRLDVFARIEVVQGSHALLVHEWVLALHCGQL